MLGQVSANGVQRIVASTGRRVRKVRVEQAVIRILPGHPLQAWLIGCRVKNIRHGISHYGR